MKKTLLVTIRVNNRIVTYFVRSRCAKNIIVTSESINVCISFVEDWVRNKDLFLQFGQFQCNGPVVNYKELNLSYDSLWRIITTLSRARIADDNDIHASLATKAEKLKSRDADNGSMIINTKKQKVLSKKSSPTSYRLKKHVYFLSYDTPGTCF